MFTTIRGAAKHAKLHGPEFFPWVCRICPLKRRAFFRNKRCVIRHRKRYHSTVVNIEEIVHPDYGNHWSLLFDG